MENSRPSSGESNDDDTQESVSSKRRSREFLTYYQRLLGRRPSLEEALNASETDDDEEEDDEKPKKWRGFFKRLFGNVVTPPDGEEKAENQHSFNPDAWYGWQTGPNSETPTISAEVDEQPILDSTELPTVETEELTLEETTPTTIENVETPNETQDESVETIVEPTPLPEQTNEYPTEVEAVIPHESPAAETTQPIVERQTETVVERGIGGGLPLVLVGAEYLGRKHADKKIRKEFNEKIDRVEQKTSQQEVNQTQLETLIQQNKHQLETLKRERGMAQAEKQEVVAPRVESKLNLPPPEERVPTERILESVVDAAEHNVPVERVFERSHEVKDEPSVVGSVGATAQSIGAVMANQMAQHQAQIAQAQASTNQGLPVIVDEQTAQNMYAQAMRSGFIGGIMIIILGLLAYLVIQLI